VARVISYSYPRGQFTPLLQTLNNH
jgi:hypothetical protein